MRWLLLVPSVLLFACEGPEDTAPVDTDVVDTDDTDVVDTDVVDTDETDEPEVDTDNPGYDVLRDGGTVTLEVAPGEEARLWIPGVSGAGHTVAIVASTNVNGQAEIAGTDGAAFVSAGWCCVTPNRHTLYVPPERARPGVVLTIRHTGGDGPLAVTVTASAVGNAAKAASALPWTPEADGWNQLDDRLGLGETRYVKLRPTRRGPHRFTVNGPSDPILTVFTDAANPSGSGVFFANEGGSCRPGTSGAWCVVFLEKDRDVFVAVQDGAGDASAMWLNGYAPGGNYETWSDGSNGRLSLPPGTAHHGWLDLAGHKSAQLTLVSVSAAFGDGSFYQPDRSVAVSNGFCCGIGNTLRYFVPPGRPWSAVETQVSGWADNSEDLVVDFLVEEVPDGATPATAVPYTSGTANHVLDKGEVRYLSWRAPSTGSVTFQANGMSWASVKAGLDLVVYSSAGDVSGSTVATCAPSYVTDQYETKCTFTAAGGTTYGVKLSQGSSDDVMFAIWKH